MGVQGVPKFMGIFGFFGKSAPSEKAIANQVQKAKEQYAKPEYRRVAMDKLLEWNTKASLKGLLGRFTVVVQSPHWDEEEKRWLVEEFVKKVLQLFGSPNGTLCEHPRQYRVQIGKLRQ